MNIENEQNKKSEDIKNLSLLDPVLFSFAAQNSQKFAEILIKPVMEAIEVEDYRIILTNFDILEEYGLKYTPVLSVAVITGEGERLILDIVNIPNYHEVIERLQTIRTLNVDFFIEKNDGNYKKLPEVITVCYSDKQISDGIGEDPVYVVQWKNMITNEYIGKYPIVVLINNEYKNEEDQNFVNIVEDLAQTKLECVKNPILRDIH